MKTKNDKIYSYISNNKLEIEKIVKEFSNYVYTIIKNNGYNVRNEDAEEIISDVFLTLWNNQYKLDKEKSMSAYIAGITKNFIRKKYKPEKYENIEDFSEELIASDEIELYSEVNEKNEIVIQELEKLNIEEQKVFMYYYFEQKSIKEISKMLNFSESKVKMKLHRTRKKLKNKLSEIGGVV